MSKNHCLKSINGGTGACFLKQLKICEVGRSLSGLLFFVVGMSGRRRVWIYGIKLILEGKNRVGKEKSQQIVLNGMRSNPQRGEEPLWVYLWESVSVKLECA